MSECRNCFAPLVEDRYMVDELLCRFCQKSPAVQVRVILEWCRERSMTFEQAWQFTLGDAPEFTNGRVRWPHDTTHRREWKEILGTEKSIGVWRACFTREPAGERDARLQQITIAA